MDRPASAGFFYCSAVGAIRKDARGAAVAVLQLKPYRRPLLLAWLTTVAHVVY